MKRPALLFMCLLATFLGAAKITRAAGPAATDGGSVMPVFDVPRLDEMTMDGKTNDWGDRGLRIDILGQSQGVLRPAGELDAQVRLGWDPQGLLVLVTVRSPAPVEADNDQYLFHKDSIELFVASQVGGPDALQVAISPGVTPAFPEPRQRVYDNRRTAALAAITPAVQVSRTRTATGYVLEVRLPWDSLGVVPAVGREVAFQINVNFAVAGGEPYQVMWYPFPGAFGNTGMMYSLRLAEKPGPAVRAALAGGFHELRAGWVKVMATVDQAGAKVELREGGRSLANGALSNEAGRATAEFALPLPAFGKPYGPIAALLDGREAAHITLPDVDQLRRAAFENASLKFPQYCFKGAAFPACQFDEPESIRSLSGPSSVRTRFYDNHGRLVATAEAPGRYAAMVDITAPTGWKIAHYHTLYRLSEGVATVSNVLQTIGSSLAKIRQQDPALAENIGGETLDNFACEPFSAMLFGALADGKLGRGTNNLLRQVRTADHSWWALLKRTTGEIKSDYLLTLPPNFDAARKEPWPLIVFLHGSGGGDGVLAGTVKGWSNFPFIILAPRSPREWWLPAAVKADLDEVLAKYPIDRERIYLTGLSMGGYGTWSVVTEYPDLFAAVAPVCGGGEPDQAERFKDVPAWIFHGAKDESVPVALGQAMADALRKVNGRVKLTIYPDAGHDSWTPTYTNQELYAWFLLQRRGKPAEPKAK